VVRLVGTASVSVLPVEDPTCGKDVHVRTPSSYNVQDFVLEARTLVLLDGPGGAAYPLLLELTELDIQVASPSLGTTLFGTPSRFDCVSHNRISQTTFAN
jgi:hypothetical protein